MKPYLAFVILGLSAWTVGCATPEERFAAHILKIERELSLVSWCSDGDSHNNFKMSTDNTNPAASIQVQTQYDVNMTITPPSEPFLGSSLGKTKSTMVTLNLMLAGKPMPQDLKCPPRLYELKVPKFLSISTVYELKQETGKWWHRIKGEGDDKWVEGSPPDAPKLPDASKPQ